MMIMGDLMRKLLIFVFAVNIILLSLSTYDIAVYRYWFPKMIWAVDTLELNVLANREAWMKCKRGVQM